MDSRLRATFWTDGDGTGELTVEASNGHFAGRGSAWFSIPQLIDFARALGGSYPLPANPPLSLVGGFWKEDGPGIDQLHVGLEFYPIGSLGELACRVQLATSIQGSVRPQSQSRVVMELRTSYEGVREFANGLAALAQSNVKEVTLACQEG
jgi:hypothetical protein